MGAGAHTATFAIMTTFKTIETPVWRSETGLSAKCGNIEKGRLFDNTWKVTVTKGVYKIKGIMFQAMELSMHVLCHCQGIFELGGVIVANRVDVTITGAAGATVFSVRIAGFHWRPGLTVRKMPS
jgi:hypothetical protein